MAFVLARTPPNEAFWLGDSREIGDNTSDCWDTCKRMGFFCPVFCCQPLDGIGNPSCWDERDYYNFRRCCLTPAVAALVAPLEPREPPKITVGRLVLQLYRGPSDHNSPKVNERTIEVALGLWFMQRHLARIQQVGGGEVAVEVGNVLGHYWPPKKRWSGRLLPWQALDLADTGQDAMDASFRNSSVLSISTLEHMGFDNEGAERVVGVRIGASEDGIEAWVRAWDSGPSLLKRIAGEAAEFLVTFPVGVNPRLDAVVARSPDLRRLARVARRVDAANHWEIDRTGSFNYKYDFRDTWDSRHVGYMYEPRLPEIYERIFGEAMLSPPWKLPLHPPFRFANAICVVTNLEELLA